MSREPILQTGLFPRPWRFALGFFCSFFVLLLLTGAGSVPFLYESQSLRYKFGLEKNLLLTGQVLGMLAATLLLLQLILSARFSLLDRIFGLNRLYSVHRYSGAGIGVLVLLHPLLVFAPEDITSLPPGFEYWPEILGAGLLLAILTIIFSSLFRRFLGLPFHHWWLAHRLATVAVSAAVILHVLYVSDTFEQGQSRLMALGAAALWVLVYGWVKLRGFLQRKKPYEVEEIARAARDTYSVTLKPQQDGVFSYLPGQFAFVSFTSGKVSGEEHPFTISSSPTRKGTLQFSIRCSGDWTAGIGYLRPGDEAVLDGPYGLFSHLVESGRRDLVMIAGGIGITPMLSMLRYMADTGDTRRITLIWSNRTREDKIYRNEFREMEERLAGLRLIDVFTRERQDYEAATRVNRKKLGRFLVHCDRESAVFICGPPMMMKEMRSTMVRLGFKRRHIHLEEFSL